MRQLYVYEWMTLDGVVQAPGMKDEDSSNGFRHGGWHLRYFDELSQRWVVDTLNEAGGFVLGRRTYESLSGYWPVTMASSGRWNWPLELVESQVTSTGAILATYRTATD